MKKIYKFIGLLAVSSLLFTTSAKAEVKKAEPAIIGVVNLLKIQSEGKAYKDIRKKRDALIEKYKEEIAKKEQEFRKIDEDLAKQEKTLSAEEMKKKKEAFKKQLIEFQSKVQKRRENISEAFIEVTSKVQINALAPVIEEVAIEKGVNIVLNNTQIVFFASFMDMTDEVLKRLDAKMPAVDFPDPDNMSQKQ